MGHGECGLLAFTCISVIRPGSTWNALDSRFLLSFVLFRRWTLVGSRWIIRLKRQKSSLSIALSDSPVLCRPTVITRSHMEISQTNGMNDYMLGFELRIGLRSADRWGDVGQVADSNASIKINWNVYRSNQHSIWLIRIETDFQRMVQPIAWSARIQWKLQSKSRYPSSWWQCINNEINWCIWKLLIAFWCYDSQSSGNWIRLGQSSEPDS